MTPDQIETARKLVAADWWEWLPGMRAALPYWERPDALEYIRIEHPRYVPESAIPDLTDDGTGGALLGLLKAHCDEMSGEHVRYAVQLQTTRHNDWWVGVHREAQHRPGVAVAQVLDTGVIADAAGTLAHAAAVVLLEVRR